MQCPSCESMVDLQDMIASVSLSLDESVGEKTQTMQFESHTIEEGSFVGKFQILKEVGKGGFGSVYKAYDQQLERIVALKIPRADSTSDLDAESFLREAQMAASVRDPNIVAVHEVGQDGDRTYICSEFIEGSTFKVWHKDEDRSIEDVCRMIIRISRSLDKAHQTGLVHRDLKPANILIDQEGNPYITDFGLARKFVTGSRKEDSGKIEIVGTPAYMSPEQAVGQVDKITSKTDIYSLGVMLYELVTRQRPFTGEVASIIQNILYSDPAKPTESDSSVPQPLEAIILKAMAKDPDERYATALELAEDLERFLKGEPTLAMPLSRSEYFAYQVRRHQIALGIVAFVIVAIGVTFWISSTFFTRVIEDPKTGVQISTHPSRANIAIVPIDPKTRKPLLEQRIQPEELTPLNVDLPAGDYIIEAYVPGFGVQEVRRTVLDREAEEGQEVTLAPIEIKQLPDSLALVNGGDFRVSYYGGGQNQVDCHVDSFYIQTTEVTCKQYQEVMGKMPEVFEFLNKTPWNAQTPITRFSLEEARSFAEKIGMRLIDYEEYCFIATNKGTTFVPWGDLSDPKDMKDYWVISDVKTFDIDKTLPTTASSHVYGLFSNVPELTTTTVVLPELVDAGVKGQENSVVIVGQPLALMGAIPTEPSLPLNATHLGSHGMTNFYNLDYPVGFRCVRSAEPRFLDVSKIE